MKIKLDADASGAVKGFGALRDAASEAKTKMHESARSQRQEWSTVGAGLTAVGVAVTGVGIAALKTGIEYNTLQQTTRAALSTLLGSAQAANAQMDKLDAFARNSPFSKQTFISAQQQMLAFGIETSKVIPYLDSVQNSVAAMGGSNQQITEIAFIMSQISAASKITGQDLMQFGQRGINAAELIGSQIGKTGAQIRQDITAGTLDADKALDALAAGMQSKFGGAAANVKNTFSGAMDRVKAAWRDFASELARPLVDPNGGGALVDLLNWAADAMRAFEALPGPVKGTVSALTGLAGGGALAAGTFMLALPRILEFKDALAALGGVSGIAKGGLAQVTNFLTGPWGIALAAAAAVVTVLAIENAKLSSQARELSETLDESTGAITANSKAWAANQLQQDGVLSAAKRLGISASDMTEAWLGNADAVEKVTDRISRFYNDTDFRLENIEGNDRWFKDLGVLNGALDGSNKVLSEAKVRHNELAEATAETDEATGAAAGSVDRASASFADASSQSQELEASLRALLETYSELNGLGQSAEQTNASLQKSFSKLQEYVANAQAGVDGYSRSLDGSTLAGASNRAMLADHAADVEKDAQAQFDLESKTLGAAAAADNFAARLNAGRKQIYDTALALTGNAQEAQKLTDKLLAVPDSKQIQVLLQGAAEAEQKIDSVAYKLSLIPSVVKTEIRTMETLVYSEEGLKKKYGSGKANGGTVGLAQGGTIPGYANGDTVGFGGGVRGGTVWGVGTAKSDSVNVDLSAGEEVIQEPYASLNRPLLKAINRGQLTESMLQPQVFVVQQQSADTPLIGGNVQFVSSGNLHSDVGTVTHALRALGRGGKYVGSR
ncbi:tape measure protein [Leucobacter albus]|uniref:Tape measure protein n=1 Tax=Leucobacter albus TaxID=272210 RepID=A0ABW3TRX1_9MICO